MNTGLTRLIPIVLTLAVALLLVLANHQAVDAYAHIRLTGAATSASTGTNVRWLLANPNGRATIANRRIQYVIGDSGTRHRASITGPHDEFVAIQKSFNVWRDERRSDLDFEFAGTTNTPSLNGNDAQNTVYWASSGLDPSVFAETTTTFDTTTGEIVDADLVFNDALDGGVGFLWDTIGIDATSGSPGKTYVENIAVHEIGHFLGLDHSVLANSTLFAFARQGAVSLITLNSDDIAPMAALYPESRYPIDARGTVSGIVRAGGVGRLGVALTLVDVASGEPVMSVLSDRQTQTTTVGQFQFDDVPAGVYWLMATPSPSSIYGSYYAAPYQNFLPAIYGVAPNSTGVPTLVRMDAGGTVTGIDFTIANATDPFEPDDTSANATTLAPGRSVGSLLDAPGDVDYFEVTLSAGATLNARVHAAMLSSDLNPTMTLFDSDGTSVITTGDFGATNFDQDARDIQFDDYLAEAQNQDCRISYTNPNGATSKTIYIAVKGTGGAGSGSGSAGHYVLTTWSTSSFAAIDQTQSTLEANILGGTPSGAAFTVTITPRTTAGIELNSSTQLYYELIDVTNNSTVVDSATSQGPWTFTVNRPGVAGEQVYAARIGSSQATAITLDQRLSLSFANAVDATQSEIFILTESLVRDGDDQAAIEIYLRDAAGNGIVDATHTVMLSNTGGSVTSPTFDADTGVWRATLTAPSSGTGLTVSATADGVAIGSDSISLVGVASSQGLPPVTSTKKKSGGGGCAVGGTNQRGWQILLALVGAIALMVGPRSRKALAGASRKP